MDPATFFLLISFAVHCGSQLQHPNTSVPALYGHFLQLWQSVQSVPNFSFLDEWFCLAEYM